MSTFDRIVQDAIRRIEHARQQTAGFAHRNALLACVRGDRLGPLPAVALVEIDAEATCRIGDAAVLRSREPLGGRELELTLIHGTAEVQPWRVDGDVRMVAAPQAGRASLCRGLRFELVRDPASPSGHGTLTLHVDGGPHVTAALASAVVVADGLRIDVVPRSGAPIEAATDEPLPAAIRDMVAAYGEDLLDIRLPAAFGGRARIELLVGFTRSVPVRVPVRVRTNVFCAWNSRRVEYPAFDQFDPPREHGALRSWHELRPALLDDRWRAWHVVSVRASRTPLVLRARDMTRASEDVVGWWLAWLPASITRASEDADAPPSMAVQLTPSARDRLAALGDGPRITYLVTTGTRGNGMAPGAELEIVDALGLPHAGVTGCRFVTGAAGGGDGLDATMLADLPPERLVGLEPGYGPRRVADVVTALHRRFGEDVQLVDPRDLLRTSVVPAPLLVVRVRLGARPRAAIERDAVLRSAEYFLARELAGTPNARIRLQAVDAPAERAEP